ncbi:hypothetical protein GGR51DRAFT_319527 [Nemania sp. FL0031]|nr:hypothetical protein GGR51DRAFT_319527 [Nemania sp. FL0031]
MSLSYYRIYIRFGENNCVRLFAPGDGTPSKAGLELFEWVRDPDNITRLRNGIQYIHEVDWDELGQFLEYKLLGDRKFMVEQMDKYPDGGVMLNAFKSQHLRFSSLGTGADMLQALSTAKEITVIPRAPPRKRSDQPGWLYLIDLDKDTLEVYEFRDYTPSKRAPSARLTTRSLFRKSPGEPQGYYIKLKLSEIQEMWRNDWISSHQVHAESLKRLWKRNALVLQHIPHADSISFPVLYGGDYSYGRHSNKTELRSPRWLTWTRVIEGMAALNRRKPSKVSIFERNQKPRPKPKGSRRVTDAHINALRTHILGLQAMARSARQRKRA